MGGDSAALVSSREARCHGSMNAQHRRLGEKRSRKRVVLEPLVLGRGAASFLLSEALTLGKGVPAGLRAFGNRPITARLGMPNWRSTGTRLPIARAGSVPAPTLTSLPQIGRAHV